MNNSTAIKKRGRPTTNSAMTPAQRKAKQRKKAIDNYSEALEGIKDFSEISLTALYAELQKSVQLGYPEKVNTISRELEKRAKANKKVTVTKKKETQLKIEY